MYKVTGLIWIISQHRLVKLLHPTHLSILHARFNTSGLQRNAVHYVLHHVLFYKVLNNEGGRNVVKLNHHCDKKNPNLIFNLICLLSYYRFLLLLWWFAFYWTASSACIFYLWLFLIILIILNASTESKLL